MPVLLDPSGSAPDRTAAWLVRVPATADGVRMPAMDGTMTFRAAELQPASPQRETGVPGVPTAAGATPAAAPDGPPGGTVGRAGRAALPPRGRGPAAGPRAARRRGPPDAPGRRARAPRPAPGTTAGAGRSSA